ncbi:DUF2490 domain-containing protein, partial [Myxococcota bacterium]|nr:DUF2490 domain-containing protein [Myxococcota bacterium]
MKGTEGRNGNSNTEGRGTGGHCLTRGSATRLVGGSGWVLTALAVAGLFASSARAAVEHQAAGWLMLAGMGSFESISPEWSRVRWTFDGQARFFDSTNGLGQTIVRPGIGWALSESTTVWVGYGWIRDYPAGRSDIDENRLWQQLLWNGGVGGWSIQSRTRLEQRFLDTGDDVGWRFREFVKVLYPLLESNRLRFAAYNELFLNLNSTDWGADSGFDQNRLFVGLNAPVNSARTVQAELGYLNRY